LQLSDDADAPAAIESLEGDLGLKWELFDFLKVNVLHFDQLRNAFEGILEGNLTIFSDVADVSDQ
jgi:hypothetical protein